MAIVGATVLAGALLVVPMAAAPAAAPEPQQQAGCPTTSAADGAARTWVGTPTAALVRAADRLQQLADDHPGSVSGVAFCPDYTGVEILVKDGAGSVAAKIHEVAARDPQQLIYVRFVQRSLDDLLKEQRRILEEAESAGVPVTGVSPDILNDGLVVSVESRDLEAGEVRSSDEALQRSHPSNRLEDPEASPATCLQASQRASTPGLTQSTANEMAGKPVTICRTSTSTSGTTAEPPTIIEVSAQLTSRPGWAEAVATDTPVPAGCVESVGTRVYVLHEGTFLLARNCGTSGY